MSSKVFRLVLQLQIWEANGVSGQKNVIGKNLLLTNGQPFTFYFGSCFSRIAPTIISIIPRNLIETLYSAPTRPFFRQKARFPHIIVSWPIPNCVPDILVERSQTDEHTAVIRANYRRQLVYPARQFTLIVVSQRLLNYQARLRHALCLEVLTDTR